jgi:hypothetical protein
MAPDPIHVNVCFVMDCTASMEPYIHEAKTRMVQLTDRVRDTHPHANILVSFVGYRDYGDAERLIVIPFQPPTATMVEIESVHATGGDDFAEDVAHGLEAALHLDWSDADVKIVFHIADAPAHGRAFHDLSVSDRFPRGDPEGLDPRDFVQRMSLLEIHFTFVKIHESTDTMIEQFDTCYTKGGVFAVIDLKVQSRRRGLGDPEAALSVALTRSITDSITQHCTSSQEL